tara:strand:- start:3011 stop:3484 length:474 start_codon:yes stop_codon:yes gene_type:complete
MTQMSGLTTKMVMVNDWTTAMVTRDAWRREGMLATISRRGPAFYGGQPRFRVRGRHTRLLDGTKPHRVAILGPLGRTTIETAELDSFGDPIKKEVPCHTYTYPSDRWLVPDSNPPEFIRVGAETVAPEIEEYTQRMIADALDAHRAAVESQEKKEGE